MVGKKLKYPPEFKKEVCEAVFKLNIKNASLMYGLNSDTVGRWFRKYKVSGEDGLRSERNDTNKKKLSPETIEKIREYRALNPKTTLKHIKDHFNLDCSLFLLSKKTGSFKKKQTADLSGSTKNMAFLVRKVYEIKFRNEISSLFEFSLCSCEGNTLFSGFTKTRNARNICLFIRLALNMLNIGKNKGLSIRTKIQYIKRDEFESIVNSEYNAELIVLKDMKYERRPGLYSSYKIKTTSDVIYDSYRKYFSELPSSDSLKNMILTPLVNFDRYTITDKCDMVAHSFPSETKISLYRVLKDIKKDGDSAVLEFDFNKADKEYEKAYSVLMTAEIKDEDLQLELLLKRAELLYNTEKFQSSLMLFRDCAALSEKIGNRGGSGTALFYIGMIYKMFNNRKGCLKYLRLSEKALKNTEEDYQKVLFFRTKTKADLIRNRLNDALENLKNYTLYARKNGNTELIGNSLSQYGLIYYVMKNHKRSAYWYKRAMRYNIEKGNIFDVCENIQGLINLCVLGVIKDKNKPLEYLSELKHYSQKAGLNYIGYEADYRMGIYYYHTGDNDTAVKLLGSALPGNKLFSHEFLYFSNLFFLGRVYYSAGNLSRAVRIMNTLVREISATDNVRFLLYAERILARIFFDRKDSKRTVSVSKKVYSSAVKLNEFYIAGESNKILGMIYKDKNNLSKADRFFYKALSYYKEFGKRTGTDISGDINFVSDQLTRRNLSE